MNAILVTNKKQAEAMEYNYLDVNITRLGIW